MEKSIIIKLKNNSSIITSMSVVAIGNNLRNQGWVLVNDLNKNNFIISDDEILYISEFYDKFQLLKIFINECMQKCTLTESLVLQPILNKIYDLENQSTSGT